jgi:phosphatidylglycerophosphate synthase
MTQRDALAAPVAYEPPPAGRGRGAPSPAAAFAWVAALLVFPTVAAGSALGAPLPALLLALAAYAGGVGLALGGLRHGYPHRTLGACNAVTGARLAAVAVLLAVALAPEGMAGREAAVFALATGALMLDGVDGWLARRARLTSEFGARFDMEVDCALAAVLALLVARTGWAEGAPALASLAVLGGARYAFVLCMALWPRLRGALPERMSRKAVCVAQIATLAGLLLPALRGEAALPLAVCVAGLVLWSFGRDAAHLLRAG